MVQDGAENILSCRLGNIAQHAFFHFGYIDDDGKLVTAGPGDAPYVIQLAETLGNNLKNCITGIVPEAVIDLFEVVDVKKGQSKTGAGLLVIVNGFCQIRLKADTVEYARQRIDSDLFANSRFGSLTTVISVTTSTICPVEAFRP